MGAQGRRRRSALGKREEGAQKRKLLPILRSPLSPLMPSRKKNFIMTVRDISTEEELAKLLDERDVILLDFWAPWCPPCKEFKPVYEAAAERHGDVAFCRVNTQSEEGLSDAFGVEHIPTLVVLRERVMLAAQPGYLKADQLDDLLRQVREVDMEEILEDAEAPEKRDS